MISSSLVVVSLIVVVVLAFFCWFVWATVQCDKEGREETRRMKEKRETVVTRMRENFLKPKLLWKLFPETRHIKGQKTNSEHSASGGFFLLIGGYDARSRSSAEPVNRKDAFVTFSWDSGNNTYCVTRVPLSLVRIKITENSENEKPSVQFSLRDSLFVDFLYREHSDNDIFGDIKMENPQEFFDKNLLFATIICSQSDCPQELSFPLDKAHIADLRMAS